MKTNKFKGAAAAAYTHHHICMKHQQAGKNELIEYFSFIKTYHKKTCFRMRERERECWLLSKEQKMKAKLSMKERLYVKVAR